MPPGKPNSHQARASACRDSCDGPGTTSAAGRNVTPMRGHWQDAEPAWERLRSWVSDQAPRLSAPQPAWPGLCASCRGPVRPGHARCFQCDLHAQCAPGSLADLIVPVAYAGKGGAHARNLWLYKSDQGGAAAARAVVRAMLVVFLRDHGPCVWAGAGMAAPTHLAVVPSGRGRRGPHPLRALIAPYLAMPWAELSARPGAGQPSRDLDPDRYDAPPLPGSRVVLMDDTWTTGASAQSAAMALRRAGARSVAVIVVGRHLVGPAAGRRADSRQASFTADFSPAVMPFRLGLCAVHCVAPGGRPRDAMVSRGVTRSPREGT
jgi:hypothetical protein